MSRDPWQLHVFCRADELAVRIYEATKHFPVEERFGLRAQIRRSAVSVPTNIVEGSARWSPRDYLNLLNHAQGSGAETRYLIHLSGRLGYLTQIVRDELWTGYYDVCKGLQALVSSIRVLERSKGR